VGAPGRAHQSHVTGAAHRAGRAAVSAAVTVVSPAPRLDPRQFYGGGRRGAVHATPAPGLGLLVLRWLRLSMECLSRTVWFTPVIPGGGRVGASSASAASRKACTAEAQLERVATIQGTLPGNHR